MGCRVWVVGGSVRHVIERRGSGIGVGIHDCAWWGCRYMVVLGGVGWAIDVGSLSHMLMHCSIWAGVVVVVDGPCRVCWVLWG